MSCNLQKFGSATVAGARSSADLKQLLKDPLLEAVYGICEGISSIPWWKEKKKMILKDLGILAFGRNPALTDAVLCGLMGIDVEEVSWLSYLKPTGPLEEVFGSYERRHLVEAKAAGADWFPS